MNAIPIYHMLAKKVVSQYQKQHKIAWDKPTRRHYVQEVYSHLLHTLDGESDPLASNATKIAQSYLYKLIGDGDDFPPPPRRHTPSKLLRTKAIADGFEEDVA